MRTIHKAARAMLLVTAASYGLVLAACTAVNSEPPATQAQHIQTVCAALTFADDVIQADAKASTTLKADSAKVVQAVQGTCSNPNATYTTAEINALQTALTTLESSSGQQ
jgi:hypothetical protein